VEFIPGLIYGYINSTIFTFKKSSTYAIANQLLFFVAIFSPFGFPFSKIIQPTLGQWMVMLISGYTVLFNILMIVKLMQSQRVSVVMGVMSGVIIIGTSSFVNMSDYVAFLTIALSILVLLKM
jgi:hypothetical protein